MKIESVKADIQQIGAVKMDEAVRKAIAPTRSEISLLPLSSNSKVAGELLTGTGQRVIDIGCGEGKFTRSLVQYFADVHGIDVKSNKIQDASAAAAREGISVTFRTASGEAIPESDNSFDVVIFSNSLHHMPSPDKALGEAMRLLKRSGYLYIMEPVASGNYHDATCLVNDETIVRTAAYLSLMRLPGIQPEIERMYRGRRVFSDFEEWRDDQIDRDSKRKIKFDAQPELIRECFEKNADLENGKLAFDQVYRVNLMRKV